jgi:P27 family predicted phage terminase small subunit
MGKRGPPPKDRRVEKQQGNPGKRRARTRTQQAVAIPECPEWLSPSAREEWYRILTELQRGQLITLVDRAALTAYCQAWAELQWATETIEREGRITESEIYTRSGEPTGQTVLRTHPAVKMQRDAFARVKAYLGEFGLTPLARLRVQAQTEPKTVDPFEELCNRGATKTP